jgi:hypothetical protein
MGDSSLVIQHRHNGRLLFFHVWQLAAVPILAKRGKGGGGATYNKAGSWSSLNIFLLC